MAGTSRWILNWVEWCVVYSTGGESYDGVCVKLLNIRGGMLQETIENVWLCDFPRAISLPDPLFFKCVKCLCEDRDPFAKILKKILGMGICNHLVL